MIKKIRAWLRQAREAELARIDTRLRVAGYRHAAAEILLWAANRTEAGDARIAMLREQMADTDVPAGFRNGIHFAFQDYASLAERKQ